MNNPLINLNQVFDTRVNDFIYRPYTLVKEIY